MYIYKQEPINFTDALRQGRLRRIFLCFDRRKRLQVSCIIGLCSMQYRISGKGDCGIIFKKAEFVAQIFKQRCLINFLGNVEVPLILFLVRGITYCILGFHCHAWKFTHPFSQNEDPFRTN